MTKNIIVNARKLDEEIAFHEKELAELRAFRDRAIRYAIGEQSSPTKRRAGRPKRNEVRDLLVAYIDKQAGEFSNVDMKSALNGQSAPKYKFRATINELVESRRLIELEKPAGVRPGKYKKGSAQ